MKKNDIKKIILILFSNIVVFLLLMLICEYYVYGLYIKKYKKEKHPRIEKFGYDYVSRANILIREKRLLKRKLRKPDGLEYKNKKPIVVFGCSYAYGAGLNQNQTFTYKLAHILKIPVYNRAASWGSLQDMWYQVAAEGQNNFLKEVPIEDVDIYIYIMTDDHCNEAYTFLTVYTERQFLNYINKKGELKKELQNTWIQSILRFLYTYRHIENMINFKYVKDYRNWEKVTDRAVLYISETKNTIERLKNKKIKFIVVLYDKMPQEEMLRQKFKKQGIEMLYAYDMTDVDLREVPYTIAKTDKHPSEKAWNLLTPLIAKEVKRLDYNEK